MKSNKIIRSIWLIVAILSLAAGIHKTIYHGFSASYQFYIIFLIAVAAFLLRLKLKKQE